MKTFQDKKGWRIYCYHSCPTRMSTLTTFIHNSTGSPNQSKKERKIKGTQAEKKKAKFFL